MDSRDTGNTYTNNRTKTKKTRKQINKAKDRRRTKQMKQNQTQKKRWATTDSNPKLFFVCLFIASLSITSPNARVGVAYHQYGVGSRSALYITKRVHSTRSRKW